MQHREGWLTRAQPPGSAPSRPISGHRAEAAAGLAALQAEGQQHDAVAQVVGIMREARMR